MEHQGDVIEGELVNLRRTEERDLPFLQALWNDGRTMASVGYPFGLDITAEEMRRWWVRNEMRSENARYGLTDDLGHRIVETKLGLPVGESGFSQPPSGGMATLELKIQADHWGSGYGSDALRALIRHTLDHTNLDLVVVEPALDNHRARTLYAKLGFEPSPRLVLPGRENRGLFMALSRARYREAQRPQPVFSGAG